ncbi:dTDP-glucose 4,6-dehydratase [Variovorax sp. HW608]|uniref:NAD-dependent epimerase/dehydratase family protein n=1 Tax=Variovorax sp. HW608 TaxID=1034889 RepID=UPI00081FC805|nr:NAD(P)-dependent oxidoreductase [Variovorax sp. HW608]SCK37707.1 dTDP-glucose 4,6-dehydratase [Variovorax sp. HW608]
MAFDSTESVGPVPRSDLDELLRGTSPQVWEALRHQSMLITGGTGFVGKWLLEALLHADREFELGLTLSVLTRDPNRFGRSSAHLAHAAPVDVIRGDVCDFEVANRTFSSIIHAALPVSAPNASGDDLAQLAEAGTRRVCEVAASSGAGRLLHISSGAVYGPPRNELPLMEESHWNESQVNEYTRAKRLAETVVREQWPFEVVIARCFAFIGPAMLPSSGSAAAQFIESAALGQGIVVHGTGETLRSYQYASDMARWLLTCLILGRPSRAYNVGHASGVTIAQLACQVTRLAALETDVRIEGHATSGLASARYLPDVHRAERELGLHNSVDLQDAILRTLAWRKANCMYP